MVHRKEDLTDTAGHNFEKDDKISSGLVKYSKLNIMSS